ncbi:MAG: hypothetical protein ACI81G_000418 [Gammaproteobacteria bacterium]|jgi:hypothetical protein
MAPMKLEDRMKERLEKRTIDTSPAAWDRIAGKLETQAVVKKSNRKLWMAIAASFIGGVIATLVILNQQPLTQGNDQLVISPDVEAIKEIEHLEFGLKPAPVVQDEGSVVADVVVATEIVKEEITLPPTSDKGLRKQDIPTQNTSAVAVASKKELPKEEPSIEAPTVPTQKNSSTTIVASTEQVEAKTTVFNENSEIKKAIDSQVETLVASVDLNSVSDEEIDALLKNAQREIISSRVFDSNTGRVDANALLLDVEAEVDPKSFRDKIFEALTNGFVKAKNAVVDRNN